MGLETGLPSPPLLCLSHCGGHWHHHSPHWLGGHGLLCSSSGSNSPEQGSAAPPPGEAWDTGSTRRKAGLALPQPCFSARTGCPTSSRAKGCCKAAVSRHVLP